MKIRKDIVFIVSTFVLISISLIIALFNIDNSYKYILLLIYVLMVASVTLLVVVIKRDAEEELKNVTYIVNENGKDMFTNIPIGIVAINSSGIILWTNNYFEALFEENVEMRAITEFFPDILDDLQEEVEVIVSINDDYYRAVKRDSAIFFFDESERVMFQEKYNNERLVMGAISFDNYEDYYNSLDEQRSNEVTSHMSKLINKWGYEHGIYLRKYSNSRYLMIMNASSLKSSIEEKFSILDSIRNYGLRTKLPLTISMSIAHDYENVSDIAESVFDGLDLVLSRGGDQVVVKDGAGKTEYYGGRTDAIEKRNRAKARMFSGSVANLVRKSKHVIIMGHKDADFDSIGACVGMSKLALELNDNVEVALDVDLLSKTSKKLIEELKDTTFYNLVKKPEVVLENMVKESLLIVVDNHSDVLAESKEILDMSKNTIVIDHHRRGEVMIENPILTYIEPYASSTCELVTELIEFQIGNIELSSLEATAMLAGIIMDTKSFVYRTGNRTFDAAATLKAKGADTILIQDLLKEELDIVMLKNSLISSLVVNDGCAITSTTEYVSQSVLAQVADEILRISGVKASFVIGKFDDNTVSLSARSLGDVNVQVVAEKLGGGGHLTAAAARINSDDVNSIVESVKDILGGELYESNFSN